MMIVPLHADITVLAVYDRVWNEMLASVAISVFIMGMYFVLDSRQSPCKYTPGLLVAVSKYRIGAVMHKNIPNLIHAMLFIFDITIHINPN